MSKRSDTATSKPNSKVYGPQQLTDDEVMAKYGITCQTMKNYYFGKYRYTSLDDALAQAKREEKA